MMPPIVHWLPPHLEAISPDPFIDDLRPPVDLAFLFCGLRDLARHARRNGAAAAAAAHQRLAEAAAAEAGDGCGRPRPLGDGVMIICGNPGAAVALGARIIARIGGHAGLPDVHASVHTAVAVADDGDSVAGAAVPAIRLVHAAGADELVATQAVVDACGDRFSWETRRDHVRLLHQEPLAA
jgi:class 3 adenylate cyclase